MNLVNMPNNPKFLINPLNKKITELKNQLEETQNKLTKIEKEKENEKKILIDENSKLHKEKKTLNENIIKLEKEIISLKSKTNKGSIKSQIKLYYTPTLIGLVNIGATCFKNAALQCLSQTERLTDFFLNDYNKNRIINNNIAILNNNDNQLSPIFSELIHNLWNQNGTNSIDASNFMSKINEMNPLFKMGEAGDSKDFIIFILERLHIELKNHNNNTIINSLINEPLNQYDKKSSLLHFFAEFQEATSIISDIFFGFTETTNECLNCKNNFNSKGMQNPICYNYQSFNCLVFPLEEVKNMKNNSMQSNNNTQINNNRVNIYECFFYNQKTELFNGSNQNFCNICRQLGDSYYSNKIYIGPSVLILILNRGKDNIYDVKLDFYEKIDKLLRI